MTTRVSPDIAKCPGDDGEVQDGRQKSPRSRTTTHKKKGTIYLFLKGMATKQLLTQSNR